MRISAILLSVFLIFQSIFAFAETVPLVGTKKLTQENEAGMEFSNKTSTDDADLYSYKTKWYRRFSYLTFALAAGAVATHEEEQEAKDSHKTLGMVTALSFFTSSYFYFTRPSNGKTPTTSQKLTRYLNYAMIPLMILTPLAGIDASNDYKDGKKPDGIGEIKGAVTGLTVASLVASIGLIHFDF